MIAERVGPDGYASISDVVVYRDGDMKRACLVVQRKNHFGEKLPPERVMPWYAWNSNSWQFDNFYPITDSRTCQDMANVTPPQRAAAAERQRDRESTAINQQMQTFLQEDQARTEAGARAIEARAAEVQRQADARSVVAERELANRVAREDAERAEGAARADVEMERRFNESR